jgi:hypothetical protein
MTDLTIVIPTANRSDCLHALLQQIDYISGTTHFEVEVVVSDNSDERNISYNPKYFCLVYEYISEKISVVDNFNRALDKSTGEYVCSLGDDDIITSRIFSVVDELKNKNILCAVPSPKARGQYFWPGVTSKWYRNIDSCLYFGDFDEDSFVVNVKEELVKTLSRPDLGPGFLPKIYGGVVNRSVIESTILKHGNLFGGVTPDFYSAILLSSEIEDYLQVNYPFILGGASAKSTAGQRSSRTDSGQLDDVDHIKRFSGLQWCNKIPKVYSPFTVWFYSLKKASDAVGIDIPNSGWRAMYTAVLSGSPKFISSILFSLKEKYPNKLILCKELILICITLAASRAKQINKLLQKNPGDLKYRVSDLDTSYEALRALEKIN